MSTPVKYDNPPLVEVIIGVSFASTSPLKAAHVGAFWEQIRHDYPTTDDAPPVTNIVDDGSQVFEFGLLPPLRRTMFASTDGRDLIQIQQDRFMSNWKRSLEDDKYPSYEVIIERFQSNLAAFEGFLTSVGVSVPAYRQLELTYVNHITKANGLPANGVQGVLVDHTRHANEQRFLPETDGFNWVTSYPLPDNTGRLQITAQAAVNTINNEKLVRLDLTARAGRAPIERAKMRAWFDTAHQWITHGFADITSKELQYDQWKRTS